MPLPPKVCPECGDEYVHATLVCVHCDVPLVLEGEQTEELLGKELPPISELVCIRAASMGWVKGLSEELAAAGISHRIEAWADDEEDGSQRKPGHNLPFGVFVLPEHREAASEIDDEYMESQIPDIPKSSELAGGAVDGCPACGESISESATECPGCGLALLTSE